MRRRPRTGELPPVPQRCARQAASSKSDTCVAFERAAARAALVDAIAHAQVMAFGLRGSCVAGSSPTKRTFAASSSGSIKRPELVIRPLHFFRSGTFGSLEKCFWQAMLAFSHLR